MNKKKITISLSVIAAMAAIVIGGTTAFFSETQTSANNVFTTGEVKLTIKNISYEGSQPPIFEKFNENGLYFTLNDLKPLDSGKITYELENGSNEAHLCVLVENVTENPGVNDLALADMLTFKYGSDIGLISSVAGIWQPLGTMNANEVASFSVGYCFGVYENGSCILDSNILTTDHGYNPAQLGKMVADLKFYAVQTRNNAGFNCENLNPLLVVAEDLSGDNLTFNQENKDNNGPHIEWDINRNAVTVDFINPTSLTDESFFFDYQVDNAIGHPLFGVTGETALSGRFAGQVWGNFYTLVAVPANSTVTKTIAAQEEIRIRLFIGPERDYDFDWIVFQVQ